MKRTGKVHLQSVQAWTITHQEQSPQGSTHELLASDCLVLPCAEREGHPTAKLTNVRHRVTAPTFHGLVFAGWNGVVASHETL